MTPREVLLKLNGKINQARIIHNATYAIEHEDIVNIEEALKQSVPQSGDVEKLSLLDIDNEITNVHEAIEGRYDLDGSDLVNIHYLLIKLYDFASRKVTVSDVEDYEINAMCESTKYMQNVTSESERFIFKTGFIHGAKAMPSKMGGETK